MSFQRPNFIKEMSMALEAEAKDDLERERWKQIYKDIEELDLTNTSQAAIRLIVVMRSLLKERFE